MNNTTQKKIMNYGSKWTVRAGVYIKSRFSAGLRKFPQYGAVDSNILRATARLEVVVDVFRSAQMAHFMSPQ